MKEPTQREGIELERLCQAYCHGEAVGTMRTPGTHASPLSWEALSAARRAAVSDGVAAVVVRIVQDLQQLHSRSECPECNFYYDTCDGCGDDWPCATMQYLEGYLE